MSHGVGAIVFPTSHPSKQQPCELLFLGSRPRTPCRIRLTQPHPEPSVYLQYTIKDLVPDKSSVEDVSESLHEELQLKPLHKEKCKFKIISLCLVDLCPILHNEDLDKSTLSPTFVELAKQKEIQIVVNWNLIPERRRQSLRLFFGVLKSMGKHVHFDLENDRPLTISRNINDIGGTGRGSVGSATEVSPLTTQRSPYLSAAPENTGEVNLELPPVYTPRVDSKSKLSAVASTGRSRATPVPQVPEPEDRSHAARSSTTSYSLLGQTLDADVSEEGHPRSTIHNSIGPRQRTAKLPENIECVQKKRERSAEVAIDPDKDLGYKKKKRPVTQKRKCRNNRTGEGPGTNDTQTLKQSNRVAPSSLLNLNMPGSLDGMVRQYCEWQVSRVEGKNVKKSTYLAGKLALELGLDLDQLFTAEPEFFIREGVKPGVAHRFVRDVKLWLQGQNRGDNVTHRKARHTG